MDGLDVLEEINSYDTVGSVSYAVNSTCMEKSTCKKAKLTNHRTGIKPALHCRLDIAGSRSLYCAERRDPP
jgi:hypothetical protein